MTASPVSLTRRTHSSTRSEYVTLSVFVLSGTELKASVEFAGPIADPDIRSALPLHEGRERWEHHGHQNGLLAFNEAVDFEHLNMGEPDLSDLDEFGSANQANPPEDETPEARRERRAKQRKQALEARQRREQQKVLQKNKVRNDGDPYLKTMKIENAGWYMFCVASPWQAIVVEMDMRKETDMGGLNEYGHVRTYEEKSMAEEDELLEEDTAAKEGIKEEDFQSTRSKLKTLRRILADIQSKQQQERHRLMIHSAMNEHSHSRMVLSSLLETVLFMAVTGFQVYTIRKWFQGAPVLGR